eukprot:jgi/Ulvmu1/2005/UM012_0168.1
MRKCRHEHGIHLEMMCSRQLRNSKRSLKSHNRANRSRFASRCAPIGLSVLALAALSAPCHAATQDSCTAQAHTLLSQEINASPWRFRLADCDHDPLKTGCSGLQAEPSHCQDVPQCSTAPYTTLDDSCALSDPSSFCCAVFYYLHCPSCEPVTVDCWQLCLAQEPTLPAHSDAVATDEANEMSPSSGTAPAAEGKNEEHAVEGSLSHGDGHTRHDPQQLTLDTADPPVAQAAAAEAPVMSLDRGDIEGPVEAFASEDVEPIIGDGQEQYDGSGVDGNMQTMLWRSGLALALSQLLTALWAA